MQIHFMRGPDQAREMISAGKAQREFRKRREARVRDLEERCRRFDQMGLEANVELQTVARRLKEENDAFRNMLNRMGLGHLINQAMDEVRNGGGVQGDVDLSYVSTTPTGMEYTLGGQLQALGKVGGRQSQKIHREQQQQAQQARHAAEQRGKSMQHDRKGSAAGQQQNKQQVQTSEQGQSVPISATAAQAAYNIPAVPGESLNPNMLHQSHPGQQAGITATSNSSGDSSWFSTGDNMPDINMVPVAASNQSTTQGSRTTGNSNQILRLDLSKGSQRSSSNNNSASGDMTLSIMDAVNRPPTRPNMTGEGITGSAMLHSDAAYMRGNSEKKDRNAPSASGSNNSSQPIMSVASGSTLGLDSLTSTAGRWTLHEKLGLTGSSMPFSNASHASFPVPHATHTSDALLNPNPIPFAFDLSSSSSSMPSNPQTWWEQLELGGAVLPPSQTDEGDDVLDEKAAMFAEAQRAKQSNHPNQIGDTQMMPSISSSGASAAQPANAPSPFDLGVFLNGCFTPGGGFMPNGASGSGSGTGEQAITPSIFPGQGGGESNILWAQSSSVSPRFSNAQTPQQQQQQSQSSQTPNGGRSAEDSSLPQTEHAQMFLRLLENKITHQGNVKDYEQLGFRPPMMAREGSDNPSSPSTGAGGNPALKRKASHDDMMRMPAPAARAKKIALSNSSENLSRESVDSLSAGSIYSRLSQHPAFLSTNVYELEELVDALGESQLQKAAGKASASAPHGKSPESASRSSSSSSNTSSSSKTSSSTTRSSSATSGTSAQSQQQQQQSSSGKATKSTSSASSHREEDAA